MATFQSPKEYLWLPHSLWKILHITPPKLDRPWLGYGFVWKWSTPTLTFMDHHPFGHLDGTAPRDSPIFRHAMSQESHDPNLNSPFNPSIPHVFPCFPMFSHAPPCQGPWPPRCCPRPVAASRRFPIWTARRGISRWHGRKSPGSMPCWWRWGSERAWSPGDGDLGDLADLGDLGDLGDGFDQFDS